MPFPMFPIGRMIPLRNEQYFEFLMGGFRAARKRIWAAIFIINPRHLDDLNESVRRLQTELAYARWRNVDVRILIGKSETEDIEIANATAHAYFQDLGVPAYRFSGTSRRSLHSKYVLLDDDLIVLGSHNWTPGAADGENNEDSIGVSSEQLNTLLRDEFLGQWASATSAVGEQT